MILVLIVLDIERKFEIDTEAINAVAVSHLKNGGTYDKIPDKARTYL